MTQDADDIADLDRLIERVMAIAVKGCCGDAPWRGYFCSYHQGMLAGLEMGLDASYKALLNDGEVCG